MTIGPPLQLLLLSELSEEDSEELSELSPEGVSGTLSGAEELLSGGV